ncbi:MAG: hypothetical protein HY606_05340 [Planctomycetes bacterium]|nr:hypothetical protein [Planctomycetota bacterium]
MRFVGRSSCTSPDIKVLANAFQELVSHKILDLKNIQDNINQINNLDLFDKSDHLVHLGIGGSSNGAKLLISLVEIHKKVTFLEEPLSEQVKKIANDLGKALCFVVSKSGVTYETISLLSSIYQEDGEYLFSTEEGSPLHKFAEKHGHKTLFIPKSASGRYSMFTPAGLVTFGFASNCLGDLSKELSGLLMSPERLINETAPLANFLSSAINDKSQAVFILDYTSGFEHFGEWFLQLWSESLGRSNIHFATLNYQRGVPAQHHTLQAILDAPMEKKVLILADRSVNSKVVLRNKELNEIIHARSMPLDSLRCVEKDATKLALESRSIPCFEIEIEDRFNDGVKLAVISMIAVAAIGLSNKTDPFVQPAVELIKQQIKGFLKP